MVSNVILNWLNLIARHFKFAPPLPTNDGFEKFQKVSKSFKVSNSTSHFKFQISKGFKKFQNFQIAHLIISFQVSSESFK